MRSQKHSLYVALTDDGSFNVVSREKHFQYEYAFAARSVTVTAEYMQELCYSVSTC